MGSRTSNCVTLSCVIAHPSMRICLSTILSASRFRSDRLKCAYNRDVTAEQGVTYTDWSILPK
jgi:hypothetical protein